METLPARPGALAVTKAMRGDSLGRENSLCLRVSAPAAVIPSAPKRVAKSRYYIRLSVGFFRKCRFCSRRWGRVTLIPVLPIIRCSRPAGPASLLKAHCIIAAVNRRTLAVFGTGGNANDAPHRIWPVSLDVRGDAGVDAYRLAHGRHGAAGIALGAAGHRPSPGGRSVLGCLPRSSWSPPPDGATSRLADEAE